MAKTDVKVELFYSGGWHDITATNDVYTRDPITITRGRPDQVSRIPPSTVGLTIENRDGKYSPRNPMSPLYGLIGRNTPIRVSVGGSFRFTGEVESWPQRWDVKGSDVWAPITANGILRRLNAPGTVAPAMSALRRTVRISPTAPWAYWPMESDSALETAPDDQLLSPIRGVPPMTQLVRGASFGKGLAGPGSAGVPDFRTGGTLVTSIPDDGLFVATTGWTIEFVARFDNNPASSTGLALRWLTPGAEPSFWEISAGPNMDLFFGNGTTTQGSAAGLIDVHDGVAHHYRITAQQSGANIIIKLYRDGILTDTGDDFGGPDPLVTGTLNRPTTLWVSIGNNGVPSPDLANGLGHVTVWHGVTPPVDTVAATKGYAGEVAGVRIDRLCTEEGIPVVFVGDKNVTEPLGAQRIAPFLDLLQDAADADGGILYEQRGALGLAYRTHVSLYNQAPTVTLNYAAGGEAAPSLKPVEDTAAIGNDITVTRYQGGSARAEKTTGTLNVQEPPTGVGRYPKDVTLILAQDSQCLQQAAWRRHLGTWDEARYPVVNMDLTAMAEAGKTTLVTNAASLDVGDRFIITSPPPWLPPESIEQRAQGFTETIGSHRWFIATNATPALPYDVLKLETDVTSNLSRIPTAEGATTLNEVLDATETGVDIISATVRWIDSATYPAQFPFDIVIGGERMRVTDCTGTTLTQTFTVTRSTNGVVKSHSIGEVVQLFRPPVIAR